MPSLDPNGAPSFGFVSLIGSSFEFYSYWGTEHTPNVDLSISNSKLNAKELDIGEKLGV